MTFKSWRSYINFAEKVKTQSRFIRDDEDQKFFDDLIQSAQKRVRNVPKGEILYRAQKGGQLVKDPKSRYDYYTPYGEERMKPLNNNAQDGRINPRGIPVLYLATPDKTAMSEVRPWLGEQVSCAQFEIVRDLKIINCSIYHGEKNFVLAYALTGNEPEPDEQEKIVWTDIDNAFSEPTTAKDDKADYIPTQIISELFKSHGFDGVAYKSNFGEGYNLALFNSNDAKFLNCHLFNTTKAEFDFSESPYSRI